jgi:hypothetical protein
MSQAARKSERVEGFVQEAALPVRSGLSFETRPPRSLRHEGLAVAVRTETEIKPLKTNDPAKCPISHPE